MAYILSLKTVGIVLAINAISGGGAVNNPFKDMDARTLELEREAAALEGMTVEERTAYADEREAEKAARREAERAIIKMRVVPVLCQDEHGETYERDITCDFGLTDMGNADRLVCDYGDDIRFCATTNTWYIWNGKHWEPDLKAK